NNSQNIILNKNSLSQSMEKSEREFKDRLLAILKDCYNVYTFLGKAYEKEVAADFLKEIIDKSLIFLEPQRPQEMIDEELKEGLKMLGRYLNGLKSRVLKQAELELAVEYANLFLGVKGLPHPSESAYKSGFLMGDSTEDVIQTYRDAGVNLKEDFREPADHVAVELYFMAYLSYKAAESLADGRKYEVEKCLQVMQNFLDNHLLSWIPSFTENVLKFAETDFYRGLAAITKRFIELNKTLTDHALKILREV
ncbi:MAG: molecular chaperone TorD family protein, partial [Candidatus Bathyarchaeia archaeon]